jgi:hypothetical protein
VEVVVASSSNKHLLWVPAAEKCAGAGANACVGVHAADNRMVVAWQSSSTPEKVSYKGCCYGRL